MNKIVRHFVFGLVMVAMGSDAAQGGDRERAPKRKESPSSSPQSSPRPTGSPTGSPMPSPRPAGRGGASPFNPLPVPSLVSYLPLSHSLSSESLSSLESSRSSSARTSSEGSVSQASSVASTPSDPTVRPPNLWGMGVPDETESAPKRPKILAESESAAGVSSGLHIISETDEMRTDTPEQSDKSSLPLPPRLDEGSPTTPTTAALTSPFKNLDIRSARFFEAPSAPGSMPPPAPPASPQGSAIHPMAPGSMHFSASSFLPQAARALEVLTKGKAKQMARRKGSDSSSDEETDLHVAAGTGDINGVRTLIESSQKDINALDQDKHTPLYCALLGAKVGDENSYAIVKLLIDNKADLHLHYDGLTAPDGRTVHGRTALEVAEKFVQDPAIIKLLREAAGSSASSGSSSTG